MQKFKFPDSPNWGPQGYGHKDPRAEDGKEILHRETRYQGYISTRFLRGSARAIAEEFYVEAHGGRNHGRFYD